MYHALHSSSIEVFDGTILFWNRHGARNEWELTSHHFKCIIVRVIVLTIITGLSRTYDTILSCTDAARYSGDNNNY